MDRIDYCANSNNTPFAERHPTGGYYCSAIDSFDVYRCKFQGNPGLIRIKKNGVTFDRVVYRCLKFEPTIL